MTHTLPMLPYATNALAPYMSEETIQYHHGKHLQAYVNNLNNLIPETEFAEATLEEIVKKSTGPIFNNAGQVYNHTLFFNQFSPTPKKVPTGDLAAAINRDFESFENFKTLFTKAALGQFGSGWACLAQGKDGKLVIETDSNAGTPLTRGLQPLMNIDVWEHSYYIDYRNNRAEYVKNFWEILDWNFVEKRFK